jgi:transposase
VDALGNLAHFLLLPGQRHDSVGAEPLLDGIEIGALIANKGFDNDALRQELDARGATAVIPPKADRVRQIPCDFAMYRWRHLVENFFCDLKQFRRVATRYDKTDQSFSAMIYLAASLMALRRMSTRLSPKAQSLHKQCSGSPEMISFGSSRLAPCPVRKGNHIPVDEAAENCLEVELLVLESGADPLAIRVQAPVILGAFDFVELGCHSRRSGQRSTQQGRCRSTQATAKEDRDNRASL